MNGHFDFRLYIVQRLAAAVHGSIGLRTVLDENSPVKGRLADIFALALCVLLLALGLRAVVAIT